MFRRSIFHGIASGLLAAFASVIYANVYNSSLGTDFSAVVKPTGIFLICTIACLLASAANHLLSKWMGKRGEILFNLSLMALTFLSILGPFAAQLPLTVEMPELFPGLTVPMHFFPALAWFTLKPLFIEHRTKTELKAA